MCQIIVFIKFKGGAIGSIQRARRRLFFTANYGRSLFILSPNIIFICEAVLAQLFRGIAICGLPTR
jgi:hypothetical protein